MPRWVSEERRVVSALGVIQILAWGSSYYLLTILGGPVATATGWRYDFVIGGVSLGLLVAGLASVRVGALIDRHGGRLVVASAAVLLASGLTLLAAAPSLPVYFLGWIVMGLGMGAGLYDAAFATLGRIYGREARRAITELTLWGGFASTVCWPLSAWLVEAFGWRGACLAYAGLHLAVTLPLALFVLPRGPGPRAPAAEGRQDAAPRAGRRVLVALLAAILTGTAVVAAIVSVHLVALLAPSGIPLAGAVALGMLVGPAQVGARVVDFALGSRHPPIWTMIAAASLIAAGLGLLWSGAGFAAAALLAYGAGNGLWSIARGALPLALFGPAGYAALMGKLARPSLIAQALAPTLGAIVLARFGPEALLGLVAALALTGVAAVLALWRAASAAPR